MNYKKMIIGSKKRLLIDILILLALIALIYIFWGNRIHSVMTLKKVDDYPLYTMKYYGDYNFNKYLKTGITDNAFNSTRRALISDGFWNVLKFFRIANEPENQERNSCSTFFTINKKGEMIMGRNFDWFNKPILFLATNPSDGYSSVSMVDISYLGYSSKYLPDNFKRAPLIYAPYVAFDGMNEYGLAVGEMAVPPANKPRIEKGKITIGDTNSIRLILDKAKNVDESIKLLQKYNIKFGDESWHYLIADKSGNSAVVEYINGNMVITKKSGPFQIATNFVLYNTSEEYRLKACNRYKKAYEVLKSKGGDITEDEAMELLQQISQGHTMWSIVYNLTTGNVLLAPGKKFNAVKRYKSGFIP